MGSPTTSSPSLIVNAGGCWHWELTLIGISQVASRVENLYFTYLFTLRAVQKAAPLLQALQYSSGYVEEDDQTKQLVSKLVCHQ
jgi:Endoplasmic Reticulum Oxidoreductin 1 (ERO1)